MPSFVEFTILCVCRKIQSLSDPGKRGIHRSLENEILNSTAHRSILESMDRYDDLAALHQDNIRLGTRNTFTVLTLCGGSIATALAVQTACYGEDKERKACIANYIAVACAIGSGFACVDQLGSLFFRRSHLKNKVREMDESPQLGALSNQFVLSRYGQLWEDERNALRTAVEANAATRGI